MSIHLNMIVKDEEKYLPRCLASVQPYLYGWTIADTGSSDSTPHLLTNFQKVIPGHLYHTVWHNYGLNRQEALNLARIHTIPDDHLLFIDADETLEVEEGFKWPEQLTADCYEIAIHHGDLVYWRPGLVRADLPWKWVGAVHEYLYCDGHAPSTERLKGVYKRTHPETDTRGTEKYLKHVDILLEEIKKNPDDPRSWFYLGQSYKDALNFPKSIEAYEKRVSMGGFDEEVYWSLLQIARLKEWTKAKDLVLFEAYLRAHNHRPSRIEAIGELARVAGQFQFHGFATKLAERAIEAKLSEDLLFVETDWYNWKLKDIFSTNAYYDKRYEEGAKACQELLVSGKLPPDQKTRVEKNLEFYVAMLKAQGLTWEQLAK